MLVGHHAVFAGGVRNPNRLRYTVEKVHRGRATELKRLCIDTLFERYQAMFLIELLQRDQDFKLSAEPAFRDAVQARQVKEKKLFGEREVFLQQTISDEAAIAVRQQSFIPRKPHPAD